MTTIDTVNRWNNLLICTKSRLLSINEQIRQNRKKGLSIASLKIRRRENDQLLSMIKTKCHTTDITVLKELEELYKVY